MKTLHGIAISAGIVALGAGGYLVYERRLPDTFVVSQAITDTAQRVHDVLVSEPVKRPGTIFLGGDVMLDRGIERRIMNAGNGDFSFPFAQVADTIAGADVAFVNFEGAMSDLGTPDLAKEFLFNFNTDAGYGVKRAGIDVVSLANNHALDWGSNALCDTVKRLIVAGLGTVGAGCDAVTANTPYIAQLSDGTRVAFLAYTPFYAGSYATNTRPGFSKWNKNEMVAAVSDLQLREGIDLIIVSFHWGEEYFTHANAFQKEWAHLMIDAGADVVVGHHPHVVQETEKYNNGIIFYSLGNFVFDRTQRGYASGKAVRLTTMGGVIVGIEELPITVNDQLQPTFPDLTNSESPL